MVSHEQVATALASVGFFFVCFFKQMHPRYKATSCVIEPSCHKTASHGIDFLLIEM